MLKDVRAGLRINRHDTVLLMWIFAGMFLVGEIISAIVMLTFGDADKYISIGMVMALIAAVFLPLMWGTVQYCAGFSLAIKSGATRRGYMRGQTVALLLQNWLMAACVGVAGLIDFGFYKLFFGSAPMGINFAAMVPLWAYLVVPVLLAAGSLILGATFARLGKYSQYVFLSVYLLGVFVLIRIPEIIKGNANNIIDRALLVMVHWAQAVEPVTLLIAALVVVAAASAISYASMLRLAVKG